MYKGKENYETVKHLMAGEECIVRMYCNRIWSVHDSNSEIWAVRKMYSGD